jgi:membrane protein required for colicin V production
MALLPEDLRGKERDLRDDVQATKTEAEELLRAGEQVRDAQKEFERLNNPRPEAPDLPADQPPGYGQGQRDEMNRLIESTQ